MAWKQAHVRCGAEGRMETEEKSCACEEQQECGGEL
jgi:hypothetical protein